MIFEEQLLKKLFDLDGNLCMGGASDFDLEIKDSPDYDLVTVKLNGNKAELYSRPHRKFEDVLEEIAELSDEDIASLKKAGYKWQS